jgi:hypothetical protein
MPSDFENRIELLAKRVNGLRQAVRLDNFRVAQSLRAGLPAYIKDLEGPLRDDVAHLFEITGAWLRNVDNRHEAKRQIQSIIRCISPRLKSASERKVRPASDAASETGEDVEVGKQNRDARSPPRLLSLSRLWTSKKPGQGLTGAPRWESEGR